MPKIALLISVAVLLARAVLAVGFLRWGGLAALFGFSELCSVAGTVVSLSCGKVDSSLAGLLVPVCYLMPLLFVADRLVYPQAGLAYVAAFFLHWGAKLCLGWACTVGVPCFLSVRSRGLYALIRHPLSATDALMVLCFAVAFVSPWNLLVLVLALGAFVLAVFLEERFLFGFESYRAYAHVVRWRWVLGLW